MDKEQLKTALPGIIVILVVVGTLAFIGVDGAFSTLDGLTDAQRCGESPLQLPANPDNPDGELRTFEDTQELKNYLDDTEISYENAAEEWNPFVKDGQVYIQPSGDVCEN